MNNEDQLQILASTCQFLQKNLLGFLLGLCQEDPHANNWSSKHQSNWAKMFESSKKEQNMFYLPDEKYDIF